MKRFVILALAFSFPLSAFSLTDNYADQQARDYDTLSSAKFGSKNISGVHYPKCILVDINGNPVTVATINKDLNAVTITTISTVWAPASGKKFRIMGGTISVSAAMSVLFEDNAAASTIFRTPKLAADTPYTFVVYGGQGRLSAAADNVLKATGSAAGAITGTLYGTEE